MRVEGKIPAVVYGAGQETVAVAVDPRVVTKILHSESGHNTIFDLNVEGAALVKAMIVDWQHEPIKGKLLHIDFKRIAMDKAMRVSVPVQLTGIPVGVRTGGGILDQILREVEIECLPADIPDHIDIDVSGLELYGAIHISDLPHSGSIKLLEDEHALVAHVTIIKEEAPAEVVAPRRRRTGSRQEGQGRCCRTPQQQLRPPMPRQPRRRSRNSVICCLLSVICTSTYK